MLRRMRRTTALLTLLMACNSGGGAPTGDADGSSSGTAGTTQEESGEVPTGPGSAGSTSSEGSNATTEPVTTSGGSTSTTADATTADATTGDATTEDATTGGAEVYDPDQDGPWTIGQIAGSIVVDGVEVPIECYFPTGGGAPGPYPVVVVAHGFQLPAAQYTKYIQRLATHGYVALTADFKAELFGTDHVANAQQVLAGIDWAADEPALAGVADTGNVGLTGHSLGGKLAIFGAVLDDRVRASITLDPVDGAQMCDAQKCPDVSEMLPTDIPLGFVGETLDGGGGFMPCAPEADNFLTFFAAADTPALAVTVNGANHMSFLDDVDTCGFTCSFCQAATLENDVVNALSRAYVVAFYGRHLKGEAGYDEYLIGAKAQERYVETGLVTLGIK